MAIQLSNHTLLMNLVINISRKNSKGNPILYNNNYELDSIELEFNKTNGERISADLVLKNAILNRVLFIECKDGGVKVDQADRYKTLSNHDILNARITNLSGEIAHEVVYLGTSAKRDKLIRDIQNGSYVFPVIINNNLKINLEYNKFNCDLLQSIFTDNGGIEVKDFSTEYYPFGKDDSDLCILSRLWPTLVMYAISGEEFDTDDLLAKTHNYYNIIDKSSMKELKGRIANMLDDLKKNDFNDFFAYPSKKRFKFRARGAQAFGAKLKKYIEKADRTTPPAPAPSAQLCITDYYLSL